MGQLLEKPYQEKATLLNRQPGWKEHMKSWRQIIFNCEHRTNRQLAEDEVGFQEDRTINYNPSTQGRTLYNKASRNHTYIIEQLGSRSSEAEICLKAHPSFEHLVDQIPTLVEPIRQLERKAGEQVVKEPHAKSLYLGQNNPS